MEYDFVECDACRAKPGSPGLCEGCLMNRATISLMNSRERAMIKAWGQDRKACLASDREIVEAFNEGITAAARAIDGSGTIYRFNAYKDILALKKDLDPWCSVHRRSAVCCYNELQAKYEKAVIHATDEESQKWAAIHRLEQAEKELAWVKAAHLLLANDDAFISQPNASPFFMAGHLKDGTPTLSLNMNDTFYYACADCEPFKYEDAPMLWEIAKTEGWPGLVKWASEQRAARGEDHEPLARVKKSMEVSRDNLAEANARADKAKEVLDTILDGIGVCSKDILALKKDLDP